MHFNRELYARGDAPGEKRDCSVRALAVVACISYEESLEFFKQAGRETGKGTKSSTSARAWTLALGHEPDAIKLSEIKTGKVLTLGQLVKAFPVGHYVVHISGHALAVTDGIVHDWCPRPRCHVLAAYRFC